VRLAPLPLQTIQVPYASVENAEVGERRVIRPPRPSFPPRWLQISADEAHVKRAHLSVYNGFEMEVTDITADALLRHRTSASPGGRRARGRELHPHGDLLATDPIGFRVKGHLDWQFGRAAGLRWR
jgi:hypothetical protein